MPKMIRRIINLDSAAGADNPSSLHAWGVSAGRRLSEARQNVAQTIGAHADEIIFTGNGTEANNLAIFGIVRHRKVNKPPASGGHIITSVIEHASILEPCRQLEQEGWAITYLPVSHDGLVSSDDLAKALRPDTVLVSIGYANNEIGTIQPLRELAKVIRNFREATSYPPCYRAGKPQANSYPYFHTDACQAPRFLDCRVTTLGVDLMTLNSDKIYGPKGVGCLYARRGVDLQPILYGGGQERGRRSGTENVPAIAGFAEALILCVRLREKESLRLTKLRDYFIGRLLKFSGATLNGSMKSRLPNNVNVSFAGTDSESVVLNLDAKGVACSSGSACSTHTGDASYVIEALGGDLETARSAVRLTLGRNTTKADLDYALKILPRVLSRSRL